MSTVLSTCTKEACQEWIGLCPNGICNKSSSLVFVKKYISILVSSYTYLRGVFPARAYGLRSLEGQPYHVLSSHSGLENVEDFISCVTGCFEALEKGYLEQLRIMLTSEETTNPVNLEEIIIKFSYSEDGQLISWSVEDYLEDELRIPKKTREGTLMTLRKQQLLTKWLEKVPKKGMIFLALMYKKDTPKLYEPIGFQPADFSVYPSVKNAVKIKLGVMSTPFHSTRLHMETTLIANTKVRGIPVKYGSDESRNVSESSSRTERNDVSGEEPSTWENDAVAISEKPALEKENLIPAENEDFGKNKSTAGVNAISQKPKRKPKRANEATVEQVPKPKREPRKAIRNENYLISQKPKRRKKKKNNPPTLEKENHDPAENEDFEKNESAAGIDKAIHVPKRKSKRNNFKKNERTEVPLKQVQQPKREPRKAVKISMIDVGTPCTPSFSIDESNENLYNQKSSLNIKFIRYEADF